MELYQFCKEMPKIELHAHINGSLSTEALNKLKCSPEDINIYQSSERGDLNTVFNLFSVAHKATCNQDAIYFATQSVIDDFHKDNVVYLELRTTPRSAPGMTKEDYIDSVVKAIKDSSQSIMVKLILSIDRRHSEQILEEVLDLIIAARNKYSDIIKGIDLSGDPSNGSFPRKLFERAAACGLLTTVHCAEVKNDEEVRDILDFSPNRIGHGTCIHPKYGGNDNNWKLYTMKKIPTECCLTSNVICKTSASYERHHVREWISNDLPFTLGTDDKGVFRTTLSDEYLKCAQNHGLTTESLWKLSFKTIQYTFASNEERESLRSKLTNWKLKHMP